MQATAYAELNQAAHAAHAGLGPDFEQRQLRAYAPLVKRIARQLKDRKSVV